MISNSQPNVPAGTVWDVGTRSLTIASGKTVTVKDDGTFTIRAADITLESNAKILANGRTDELGGFGAFVRLDATGGVALAASSKIDVSAAVVAGLIDIDARGGTVQMLGQLRAKATAPAGTGGFVSVTGKTGVTIAGLGIDSSGGADGDGGSIDLESSQAILATSVLDASGGDIDGGSVGLDAGTTVTTQDDGILDVKARSGAGSGGSVLIMSGGDVTLDAAIDGTASSGGDDGDGSGGDVEITSDTGNITVGALVDLHGAGDEGDGGSVTMTADGAINVPAQILAYAKANGFGLGGDVALTAGTSLAIGATIDVRGGIGGGALEAAAGTSAAITASVLATGTTSTVVMGSPVAPVGGAVLIHACTISIPQGGAIINLGTSDSTRGINRLQASSTMTIGGTLSAGNDNVLEWRQVQPTFTATNDIMPAPQLPQNTQLPCCVACSSTTSTSTTTTTTTTVAGSTTTTTTLPGSTTTTSSTIVASTTSTVVSTTLPASTTTTTTSAPPTTTTTTVPTACIDQPLVGYDAVDCRLDTIGTTLAAEPVEALGGTKLAARLTRAVTRTRSALATARAGRRVTPSLRRANKQLRLFQKGVQGALKKGMPPELGAQLAALAAGASSEIGVLRAQ